MAPFEFVHLGARASLADVGELSYSTPPPPSTRVEMTLYRGEEKQEDYSGCIGLTLLGAGGRGDLGYH